MDNHELTEMWAYHDGTKHSVESVYRSGHRLEWAIMPRPFKVYPDLEPIPLPQDFTSSTRPALAALADRGTAAGDGPPLGRAALARLLYFSAGVLRRKTYAGGEIYFRAAACTGALYHIDLYLISGPLPDLEAAVYHFGPHDFPLRRLRAGDHRPAVVAAPPPPPAPPAPPLGLTTLPLSAREVDYPAIRRAHAASSLTTAKKVPAWRGPLAPPAFTPPGGPTVPLAPSVATAEPVETVILRRGSTRTFAREPIGLAELSTFLRASTRGIPGDWAARPDLYLIVHAVDGLDPGTYVLDREGEKLALLQAGDFRREAGHLVLGQALPAEAAACVYWLVDLKPVFERYGNRGYRAAQLEAAIEGGKSYLAAYALRLGATGLTFFDDDVTRFFSPHAAGKSVMFLMAFGHPERRRAPTP